MDVLLKDGALAGVSISKPPGGIVRQLGLLQKTLLNLLELRGAPEFLI